jgi:ribosomal 50S subunit-associated protein YjgA (DUF615 family)
MPDLEYLSSRYGSNGVGPITNPQTNVPLNPRTPTKDVLLLARGKNGKIAPIECRIRQLQLRYYGHVMRKGECDPIRRIVQCVRPGAPKLGRNFECWRGEIVKAGEVVDIDIYNETQVGDRVKWRGS